MNIIEIFKRNNKLVLKHDNKREIIFDKLVYDDIFNQFGSEEDDVFNIINNKYNIKTQEDMEKNFLFLFNFILVNNIANYLIDTCFKEKSFKIIFDSAIKEDYKKNIRLRGKLEVEDILGDIVICLMNKKEYQEEIIILEYSNIGNKTNKQDKIIKNDIKKYFKYVSVDIQELKDKLENDLLEYGYVNEDKKNAEGRYLLPIYIDEEKLKKSIPNYEDFLINWTSIAFLEMVMKIHDNFVRIYNFDLEKGLINDDLTIAIISLLDAEIESYPKGIQKSIEKGKEINGKCYFIEGIVKPIRLTQDLAMVLQSRDVFGITPSLFKAE